MTELAQKMDEVITLAHKMFFRGSGRPDMNSRRQHRGFQPTDYEEPVTDRRIPPRPQHPSNTGPFQSVWDEFQRRFEPPRVLLVVPEPEDCDISDVFHEEDGYADDGDKSILTALALGDGSDEADDDSWMQSRNNFWADW